jgi:hypothetical protein
VAQLNAGERGFTLEAALFFFVVGCITFFNKKNTKAAIFLTIEVRMLTI